MELLQLTYFCSAAETGNFSQTAAIYKVPPSNISQTVSRLERELGATLFDRYANRVSLNERGREFYSYIRRSLNLIDDGRLALADTNPELCGEIRISVHTNRRIVMGVIEKFRGSYPHISFFINHDATSVREDMDLIIADESFDGNGMKKELLLKEDILLAMSCDNPLSARVKISAADLQNQRFITMPAGSSLYRYTHMICKDMGFTPQIAVQSDDPYYLRKYVELDLGIAFVPALSWKGQFSDNTAFISAGDYQRSTYVFWREDKYMPRGVRAFLSELTAGCGGYV